MRALGCLQEHAAHWGRGMNDAVWLRLTPASAEQSPALGDARAVAERAAAHPDSLDTLFLVARPTEAWRLPPSPSTSTPKAPRQ
ncbi:hypothetical protein GCM10010271_71380 [Streptomyces kurssanovii]|nr:hypothetical protein GCM10010271_71380 [Streptomyces kurssanovii]